MKGDFEEAAQCLNPAELYLGTLGSEASRRGMISPLNHAARFIDPSLLDDVTAWRKINWQPLSPPLVRAVLAAMPGSAASRKKALSALKGVARSAWELGVLHTETFQRICGIRMRGGVREVTGRHIPTSEFQTLLSVCHDRTPSGLRDIALFSLAFATGARRAEMVGLRLGDLEKISEYFRIRIIGKGDRWRSVYVESGVANRLNAWIRLRDNDPHEALFCKIRKDGRILGGTISTTGFDRILSKRVVQARLSSIRWHDFRRTAAGNMLDAGLDISTVAKVLGHSHIETTARYDRRGERTKIKAASLTNLAAIAA